MADKLEKQHGPLSLTVLVPEKNTQDEIKRLRASFIRRAISPAGIWTVETGTHFAGLHLNILSPAPAPSKYRKCKTYSELIRTTSRDAAAYISKQSGMPALKQYAGNLFGGFGQFINFCVADDAPATVQAAALEVVISGRMYAEPAARTQYELQNWPLFNSDKPPFFDLNKPKECNPPLHADTRSLADFRVIMQRHTAAIHAAIAPRQQAVY
jgi:hypothetical protein